MSANDQTSSPLDNTTPKIKFCNICSNVGTKRCSRCRCAWYCSKEHQKLDWNAHKKVCEILVEPHRTGLPMGSRVQLVGDAGRKGRVVEQVDRNYASHLCTVLFDDECAAVKIPVGDLAPLAQECPICFEMRDHRMLAFLYCGHFSCNNCMDAQAFFRGQTAGGLACHLCRGQSTKKYYQMIPVIDPGDHLCFCYTDGLHRQGHPEPLAVDVPVQQLPKINAVFSCAKEFYFDAGKEIVHGHKFGINGIKAQFLVISDDNDRRSLKRRLLCQANPNCRIVVIKPREELMDPEGDWGTDPPAPGGKYAMREWILDKWCSMNDKLTHYADSSRNKVVSTNISFESVLAHPEWVVNWDAPLTSTEVDYVNKNWNHMFQYMVSFWLRKADECRLRLYIKNVVANAPTAKQRYNAGIKLAVPPDSS